MPKRDLALVVSGALLSVVLLGAGTLALSGDGILFPDGTFQRTASLTRKSYYLSATTTLGNQAIQKCINGYHMALLWELVDLSALDYLSFPAIALTKADAAGGPPSGTAGWVRTGYDNDGTSQGGRANCFTWSSSSGSDFGSVAGLTSLWDNLSFLPDPPTLIGDGWVGFGQRCNVPTPVWCVLD